MLLLFCLGEKTFIQLFSFSVFVLHFISDIEASQLLFLNCFHLSFILFKKKKFCCSDRERKKKEEETLELI